MSTYCAALGVLLSSCCEKHWLCISVGEKLQSILLIHHCAVFIYHTSRLGIKGLCSEVVASCKVMSGKMLSSGLDHKVLGQTDVQHWLYFHIKIKLTFNLWLNLDAVWSWAEIFIKKRSRQLEPTEQQHPNTLPQVHSLKKKMGRVERVITEPLWKAD